VDKTSAMFVIVTAVWTINNQFLSTKILVITEMNEKTLHQGNNSTNQ